VAKELIFGIGGHPIMKHDFEQLQSSNFEFMEAISKFIGEDGTFKAFGCVITSDSTTISWTSGTIFYQGVYYKVDSGSLVKQIAPPISFNPFWKIISTILSPSPVTYETNIQYNVHIENKITLVEEPGMGDQGIYDAILPQLQGPLLDNLSGGGGGGTGASLQATFNITSNLGIVSVDANAVTNGDILNVISGQDINIIFARTLTTTHARYRIDSGPWISVWGLTGSQPNSKTVTIPNVITNKTITIQWLSNSTIYNINRLGSFSGNASVFVSNQEALKIVNSDGSPYVNSQSSFPIGRDEVAFDFLVLTRISIDYYPYTGTTGRTPDYFIFGTPNISTFKINGVEYKTSLGTPVLETYIAELDSIGEEDLVFFTGTGTTHYKYYEYKYLRYRIIVPNTPIADITNVQWAYTRDNDGNNYTLPTPPSGGGSGGCLQINSLITLSDGSKKELKNILVGDELLSINLENNLIKPEFTKVIDKQVVGDSKSIIFNNNLLHMTESHIQLIERGGELMLLTAKEILKGDYLIGNFNKIQISSISYFDGNELFCNIVTGNGYYIANDIITHNKTAPPADPILIN
jgi:hypothetical protein